MPTRRTLLLADDSPTIQKVVSLTFEDEGLRVVAVGSGGEALAQLAQDAPDIILADVHMPAPNGYALCARVRRDERLRHVPVLLLVGAFEPFDEAEARACGADGVLTKPFQSIRDLVSKVGGLLSGRPAPKASDEDDRREDARPESRADAWRDAALTPAAAAPAAAPALPDFDLDDQSIEAVPADSYAARAQAAAAEEHEVEAFSIAQEGPSAEGAEAAPFEFGESAAQNHTARQESHSFAAAASGFGPPASAAPAAFDSRPVSSHAEDSLLELDDIDSAPASEADDFILDFDEEPARAPHAPAAFEAAPGPAAAWHVEETEVEEPPAEISPANLSSAWNALDHPEISTRADDAHAAAEEAPVAAPFESVEVARAVDHEESDPASAVVESAGPPSAVETATPAEIETATPAEAEGHGGPKRAEAVDEPPARAAVAESTDFGTHEPAERAGAQLSQETIDAIARRVVEQMSERVLREIAWEVVPDLAERLIRQRLDEQK